MSLNVFLTFFNPSIYEQAHSHTHTKHQFQLAPCLSPNTQNKVFWIWRCLTFDNCNVTLLYIVPMICTNQFYFHLLKLLLGGHWISRYIYIHHSLILMLVEQERLSGGTHLLGKKTSLYSSSIHLLSDDLRAHQVCFKLRWNMSCQMSDDEKHGKSTQNPSTVCSSDTREPHSRPPSLCSVTSEPAAPTNSCNSLLTTFLMSSAF